MRNGNRRIVTTLTAGVLAASLLAGCGSSGGSDASGGSDGGSSSGSSGDTIKIGYSAWPGWFPLTVAEQEQVFEDAGGERGDDATVAVPHGVPSETGSRWSGGATGGWCER